MGRSRKYEFKWNEVIGNMDVARPHLGPSTRVEVYRLFQFALRDVLEQQYGTQQTDLLFREAGVLAGTEFYRQFCSDAATVKDLLQILQTQFKQLGIGVLRLEKSNLDELTFTFTVDEDLDCSGMPDIEGAVCVYDEGFLQGILQSFSGKNFRVREVDCWCTGERTCRFTAVPVNASGE